MCRPFGAGNGVFGAVGCSGSVVIMVRVVGTVVMVPAVVMIMVLEALSWCSTHY